jgi:hypothetical protein
MKINGYGLARVLTLPEIDKLEVTDEQIVEAVNAIGSKNNRRNDLVRI